MRDKKTAVPRRNVQNLKRSVLIGVVFLSFCGFSFYLKYIKPKPRTIFDSDILVCNSWPKCNFHYTCFEWNGKFHAPSWGYKVPEIEHFNGISMDSFSYSFFSKEKYTVSALNQM